jgi:TetR/AcrR family transcriptional repressor of bet genes
MKKPRHATDLTLMGEILPQKASKSQLRKIQIMEAAIEISAAEGLDGTTYDRIASYCGTSRQLVQHYFPKREEMFLLAIQYLRSNARKVVYEQIDKLVPPDSPDLVARLAAYVSGTFHWFSRYPSHTKVWPIFYSYAASKKKYREINTDLSVRMEAQIHGMIAEGKKRGQFRCKDAKAAARTVQMLVTGALLAMLTEDVDASAAEIESQIRAASLLIAGAAPSETPGSRNA